MLLRRKNHQSVRKGTSLIETAVLLVLFVMFLFGVIEFGRLILARHLVDHASREGARWAAVNTQDGTDAQLEARVKQALLLKDKFGNDKYNFIKNPVIVAYKTDASDGSDLGAWQSATFSEPILVSVTVDYEPTLPNFLGVSTGSNIQLVGRSMMRSEAN